MAAAPGGGGFPALVWRQGNDDGGHKICYDSGAGAGEDGPYKADDGGVNVKVFSYAPAYAAEHFIYV